MNWVSIPHAHHGQSYAKLRRGAKPKVSFEAYMTSQGLIIRWIIVSLNP